MELLDLSGNQTLFEVRLDGVLWNNCTSDAMCPGRALCAVNASWSAYPSMCYCNFAYEHVGSRCESIGPIGIFYVVVHSFMCANAIVWFAVGLYSAFHLTRIRRLRLDALTTSLAFAVLANLFTGILVGSVIRYATITMPINASNRKDDDLSIGAVSQGLSFLFASFSYLNISLVWIEIAENARSLKKARSPNVQRYRTALVVYYMIFLGLMIVGLALDNFVLGAVPAVLGAIFIIITYVIGFFKMRSMIMGVMVDSSNGVASTGKEAKLALRTSYRLIQNAALGMSLSALVFIVDIGVWIYLGTFTDVPGARVKLIPLTFGWFGVSLANTVIMHYLFLTIKRKRAVDESSSMVKAGSGVLMSHSGEKDLSNNKSIMTSPAGADIANPIGSSTNA